MDRFYINSVRLKETLPKSSYLASLPAIKALQSERELAFRTPVTFFVGENGTGKSTLLEAIAVGYGFNAEGGSRNFRFSTNDTHSSLYRHLVISKQKHPRDGFFLRAESLYNVATNIEQLDAAPSFDGPVTAAYGGTSLHCSSILAWNIPWKEEPGSLQSMGLKRVGHDVVTENIVQSGL